MSLQLDRYLSERAAGGSIDDACFVSGIPLTEARLTEKAIEAGELTLPRVHVRTCTHEDQSTMEGNVARDSEGARTETIAASELRLFIERIERLKEDVKGLNADVADVYKEATARGYDKATIARVVRLRAMDTAARQEAAALLETYASAVGLQDALPL